MSDMVYSDRFLKLYLNFTIFRNKEKEKFQRTNFMLPKIPSQ